MRHQNLLVIASSARSNMKNPRKRGAPWKLMMFDGASGNAARAGILGRIILQRWKTGGKIPAVNARNMIAIGSKKYPKERPRIADASIAMKR